MEPHRVSKKDRKIHLSYTLPYRIQCSKVHHSLAPNGSTIIIYGHDHGLSIVWRGGRRRKEQKQGSVTKSQTSALATSHDIIVLDDSDDDAVKDQNQTGTAVGQDEEDQFEPEEDEQDPDCPYPNIIQCIDIDLAAGVLHLAIASTPALAHIPRFLLRHIVVVVTCVDGTEEVLTIPLNPPTEGGQARYVEHIRDTAISLPPSSSITRALDAKVQIRNDQSQTSLSELVDDAYILIARASDHLRVDQVQVPHNEELLAEPTAVGVWTLPALTRSISFSPSLRSTHILLADLAGAARVFDPFAVATKHLSSAEDAVSYLSADGSPSGCWVMVYHGSYISPPNSVPRRKQALGANWIQGGASMLAVLEDGQWGIWELNNPTPSERPVTDFVLSGYLGTSSAVESAGQVVQRKGGSRLAPMTPNTRKVKAEVLFTGPRKTPGVAPSGGLSVVPIPPRRSGPADESIVLWYGNDVYAIPSSQTFRQRQSIGSTLQSSGLIHFNDINLENEQIVFIGPLAARTSEANLGHMKTQRDLLIATESRLLFLQTLQPPTPSRTLFQAAAAERPASRDQKMLDAGDLDLGGLDRMLDRLGGAETKPRRVGFAR